jgi:N-acyl-D-amino-acid deacylase
MPEQGSGSRRRVGVAALVAAAILVCGDLAAQGAGGTPARDRQTYDVVIRGGRVLDGSGNPWFAGDVGIRGDRIVAVGDLGGATAGRVIDATGLYVAPGFIDVHSHAGPALESEGLSAAEPLLAQGVTTVFVNPDGGGPVDLPAQRVELLRHGLGVNVAQMVPHGSVRGAVIGMADRAPTADEMERMRGIVAAGMAAGAFGLSSGPFYAPGSYAATEELVELARVAGRDGGVYISHIRDESDYTIGVVASVDEVIRVAREAGLPGVVTHIKALGPNVWGYSSALVQRIERARAQGVEVYADQYPYDASSTGLGPALLPRWAEEGGQDALRARIDDPGQRGRIRGEMEENLARRGGAERIQFIHDAEDPALGGRTLAQVAAERGHHPLDLALTLLRERGRSIISFNMIESDIVTLMRQPWTMTASDGALVPFGQGFPHPRAYGTFPRKIRRYVLEEGVIDLATAIRSMTSLPASVFRMPDRGVIRPGAVADVVVFDLERLRDLSDYPDPHRLSEGMVHVLVNGSPAIENGRFTGGRHGIVLSRSARAPDAAP